MAPAVQRPEPPYLQIVGHFKQQIRSGELKDGEMIPSVRQIARDWNVAPPTAGKALATLRSEGLVRGKPGVGTIVIAGATTHAPGRERLRSARSTGRIYPPGEHAVIKSAELVDAPPHVVDALGLAAGAAVIRRRRVTYRGDTPISASVTWLDGSLAETAPRLLGTERIIEGTAGYIRQMTGREAVRGTDQNSARAATEDDAEDLGVPVGSPVACARNWWFDADGNVIEYGEGASVPGRWATHDYELTAPEA
jgi:DNA-binding GntR family transcriptional regulator